MRHIDLRALRCRARAWRNIATSAAMSRLDPGWIPRPHAGHLIVTFRCNLKCQGCGSWKVKEHRDLSTAEWLDLFDQLQSLDIVKILGGEPFIRRDIVALLEGVRERIDPYVMQLTTNGMLTKQVVAAVEAVGWPGLQLRISVDGLRSSHDSIRGVDGSHDKVVETCRRVAELRPKLGFKFGINFALTDQSIDELDEMIAFAESLGADLIPGVNVDPFLVGTVPPEVRQQQVIMIEDTDRALAVLRDRRVGLRRQLPGIDHLLSRFIVKQTFGLELERGVSSFPCRELQDLIYMLPNGDLVRCGLDHEPIGNIREARFDDIWYGSRIREHRQKVRDCPGCMQASVQIMSRLYGGCVLA